jgi:hypothetical protein
MLSRNPDLYPAFLQANHKNRLLVCFEKLISKFRETAKKSDFPDSLSAALLGLAEKREKKAIAG